MFKDAHVNSPATGFKSEAYTSHPILEASNGIEPPPQKQSPTFGILPNFFSPNCCINS